LDASRVGRCRQVRFALVARRAVDARAVAEIAQVAHVALRPTTHRRVGRDVRRPTLAVVGTDVAEAEARPFFLPAGSIEVWLEGEAAQRDGAALGVRRSGV